MIINGKTFVIGNLYVNLQGPKPYMIFLGEAEGNVWRWKFTTLEGEIWHLTDARLSGFKLCQEAT